MTEVLLAEVLDAMSIMAFSHACDYFVTDLHICCSSYRLVGHGFWK